MKSYNSKDGIIGKGYLGKFLKKKNKIKNIYNSKNIRDAENKIFNNLFIAPLVQKNFLQ